MIKTKKDLKEYMEADRKQLGVNRKYPRPFTDEIWRYEIYLRKYEYYLNTQKKILSIWYKIVLHKLGVKLGIGIAPNVCGKGLSIAHYGCIEINDKAKIGNNLRIHPPARRREPPFFPGAPGCMPAPPGAFPGASPPERGPGDGPACRVRPRRPEPG